MRGKDVSMPSINFRHEGRECVSRAKVLLAQSDDHALRYAALELRMAMEALIYDRMSAYKAEVPKSIYETWQPKQVLKRLLEIDPHADAVATISIGVEDTPGLPAKEMTVLGTDTPLSFKNLKSYYDAFGSYLHKPTIKQLEAGNSGDMARLRQRCDEVVAILDVVLASAVHNSTMGNFSTCACFRCGKDIKRRITKADGDTFPVTCPECEALHIVERQGDQYLWKADTKVVPCANSPCDGGLHLWPDEIVSGQYFECEKCKQGNVLALSVRPVELPKEEPAETT